MFAERVSVIVRRPLPPVWYEWLEYAPLIGKQNPTLLVRTI